MAETMWIVTPIAASPKEEKGPRVAVTNGSALISGVTARSARDLGFLLLTAAETVDPSLVKATSETLIDSIAASTYLAHVKRMHDRGIDVASAPSFEQLGNEDRNTYRENVESVVIELAKRGVFLPE